MRGVRKECEATQSINPLWISDSESKDYLRSRKLAGDWTLTVVALMRDSRVFEKNTPVYDDGSHFSKLSFFRLKDDCAALEWDSDTLECRIWMLLHDISEAEILARVKQLSLAFAPVLDFSVARLLLEKEPNELTLVGSSASRLKELCQVVASCERRLKSPPKEDRGDTDN